MNDKQRVYLVVHSDSKRVEISTLDSDYAFDQTEELNSGDVPGRFEVKSYKLEGPRS